MGVLGLSTPEVDRWINAGKGVDINEKAKERERGKGKGKGKSVGFRDDEDEEEKEKERERERSLSMQVSPIRRSAATTTTSLSGLPSTSSGLQDKTWAPSPLRASASNLNNNGSTPAHELLKTIVQDVMYDYQREARQEMVGLHLDLVRMGRGWKKELRTLMDEYVGDLRELREENKLLREENERLRRGYC
jgi:protein NEDD1